MILPRSIFLALLGASTTTHITFCEVQHEVTKAIPVGIATVDVTPTGPVHLINELEALESEGVAQPLYAKALAFGSDADTPAVLIAFDGIGIPAAVAGEVASRLEENFGIPREKVAVCATHTHWAPHLTGLLPQIFNGPLPPAHQARVDAYTRQLVDALEQAAVEALDDRKPAQLSWATGKVTFAANRRLLGDGRVVMDDALMFTYNPDAPIDHSLPVLCVRDLKGNLRAIHFTYACHSVAITGRAISRFRNRIHGDWAGLAQEIIQQRHPDSIALCTIGSGGDARPSPVGGVNVAAAHAREIADEIDRLLAAPERWEPVSGPLECFLEEADLPVQPYPERATLEGYVREIGKSRNATARGYVARDILNRMERSDSVPPDTVPFIAQAWSFGDELSMVFLAGEVVVDFTHRIQREFDDRRLWVIAYANATPCYIVSKRMLELGGYEAGNSMFYYGRLTPLKPEAEDRVMETVREAILMEE